MLDDALRELEDDCVALCCEYRWLSPRDTPNYRLIYTHPATFKPRAGLMLVGIHPHGGPMMADVHPADLPYGRPGYSAYLDEQWGGRAAGSGRLQAIAQQVAHLFRDDHEQLLRESPSGNMIPFRSEALAALPDGLRKQGISIGARLIGLVRPRVLVMLGGDRVLFGAATKALRGRIVDSCEDSFGANQTYRDASIVNGEHSAFVAALPQRALQQGLRRLELRLASRPR